MASVGAAVLATTLLSSSPALAADQDLPGWTFQEEVDLSDASRWTTETGQASNTSSYDLPENVSFDSKGLTIRGLEQERSAAFYTSGDAKGVDIEIPNYARVEAIGSVPFGPGLWPALMWLRPLDSAHGEIDLMEVFGDDPRVAATIHNEYGATHRSKNGFVPWTELPNPDPTATHIYVMEKTPERIVFSVDGHVMLDAGPEDVRAGFDWDAIFERPGATWYPRVTLQIGCPPAEPDCGIGLPAKSWPGDSMRLESLKIWKMATSDSPPAEGQPGQKPPVEVPPAEERPVEEVRSVESGSFPLRAGQEAKHEYADSDVSAAAVTFAVPTNLGTGALYNSLQIRSSPDGKDGYRATVALRANGTIRLTLAERVNDRSTVLLDDVVASRGTYAPGHQVRVALSYADGVLSAKAWRADHTEPAWQLTAAVAHSEVPESGAYILGYLSRKAPSNVTVPWSNFASTAP